MTQVEGVGERHSRVYFPVALVWAVTSVELERFMYVARSMYFPVAHVWTVTSVELERSMYVTQNTVTYLELVQSWCQTLFRF